MSTPRTTKWSFEPRTGAKHAILDAYLKAWFPILGKDHREIVYVDGFCGPGRYAGGEPGSPLVALQAAISNQIFIHGNATFWFIDADSSAMSALTAPT